MRRHIVPHPMSCAMNDTANVKSRALLQLEGVSFQRDGVRPLKPIDWRVRAGEQWAVLGPNGSGKTTLMMIAAGYLPSSAGRTYLLEGWMSEIELPRVRQRVAFASAALHDQMLKHYAHTTGLRMVLSGRYASLGLYARPDGAALAEAQAIMRRLRIQELADREFGVMSTGQRQRCLIGRSWMAQAELVILDEPCAGLDIAGREQLLVELEAQCRKRPDVPHVLVTHHLHEIVPNITHVLLVREGETIVQGTKDDVLTAENLSVTFDLPLHLVRQDGRVWALPK